jgi:FimV-like protein
MKNKDKEAIMEVSFFTLKRPLPSLLELLGEARPQRENPAELAMRIGPLFSFLPMPVLFDIDGNDLLIRYPEEPKDARDQAAKLAHRAAQRAESGDYAGAASLWRRALKRQPSLHSARRDLAHAYVELGDDDKARSILLQVLYCNPDDLWALRALANIWFRQGDCPRAERLLLWGLAIEPANAQTLNNLALVRCKMGRKEEGIRLFRESLHNDPGLPNPYLGLACELARAHRCEEALTVVGHLFEKARRPDPELDDVLTNARLIYVECNRELLDRNRVAVDKALQELQIETQRLTGSPIRIAFEDEASLPFLGMTELVWDHGRDHHVVRFLSSYPEPFRPHIVAKALLQIQAHWEARKAGRRRLLYISPAQQHDMLELLGPGGLRSRGMEPEQAARKMGASIRSLCQALLGSAANMQVETKLKRTIPVLRSTQFFSLSAMAVANLDNRQDPGELDLLPPELARIFAGLNGLTALFLDWLFDGVTDYAAHYSDLNGFDLSRRLWERYQDRYSDLKPGDEFDLADEFAEIVGMAGRYEWRKDPFVVAESFAA